MKSLFAVLFAFSLILSNVAGASADFGEREIVTPQPPVVGTYDFGERE